MTSNSISVFFPCYNEEANVATTVNKALVVLNAFAADYEVIIVNDGSADRTGKIADQLAARIRVSKRSSSEKSWLRRGGAVGHTGFDEGICILYRWRWPV